MKGSTVAKYAVRRHLLDQRPVLLVQHKDRVFLHRGQSRPAHARVVEPPADVGVPVLVEPHLAVRVPGVHLHIRLRQRLGALGGHLQLAVVLHHQHVHGPGEPRQRESLARGLQLDQRVHAGELRRQVDLHLVLVRGQLQFHRLVRPHQGEPVAELLAERVAAEQQFHIHLVQVHRHPPDVAVADPQLRPGQFRRQRRLLARLGGLPQHRVVHRLAVGPGRHTLATRLIHLLGHQREGRPPPVHRVIGVLGRDPRRAVQILPGHRQVGAHQLVLHGGRHRGHRHPLVRLHRLGHPVLHQQVISHLQPVLVVQRRLQRQHTHQGVVLLVDARVHDLPGLPQRVRPSVHQRLVLQVLDELQRHRVIVRQAARYPSARLARQTLLVGQEFPGRLGRIMLQGERPQHRVIGLPAPQQRQHPFKVRLVRHAPGDAPQVDLLQVRLVQKRDHLVG